MSLRDQQPGQIVGRYLDADLESQRLFPSQIRSAL
jgi:hypothetical protein